MNKEKILKFLKTKVGVGITSGIICFTIGASMYSDTKTVKRLNQEKSLLVNEHNTVLAEKDSKIVELQAKVNEAKPWFDKQEEERKAEEEKLAQEKAQKEAEEAAAAEQARKDAEAEALAKGVDTNAVKSTVNSIIKEELSDQVTNTTLESLQVNENLGTDSNKDVIVLVNLSWSTQNLENTTRTMLKMYSEHLCAKLAPKLADGSEIALFWHADYTGLDIKHSGYVKNGKAYWQ